MRKRRTNGDIADVMLEKENLLSMSHNAMIPLPFLTASTEAEIVCIVDVKGNIREKETAGPVLPKRPGPWTPYWLPCDSELSYAA